MIAPADLAGIRAELDADPGSVAARVALADAYEEMGRYDKAYCQRWLAWAGKWPQRGRRWCWGTNWNRPPRDGPNRWEMQEDVSYRLPQVLMDRLAGAVSEEFSSLGKYRIWAQYHSPQAAEDALAVAIHLWRVHVAELVKKWEELGGEETYFR